MLVVLDRVMTLCSQNKVSGNELSSLVKKLVERVLGVGSRLAKEDRSSGVLDVVATASDGLAVRFHGKLLEVGRESVKVLVEAGHVSRSTQMIRYYVR